MCRMSMLAGGALAVLALVHADPALAAETPRLVSGSPRFDELVPPETQIEVIGTGYQWAEGPVWIPGDEQLSGYLLFSDVPGNTLYRWSAADGTSVFLRPSGGGRGNSDVFREPGTNGLIRDVQPGSILAADHGGRAIIRLDLATKKKTVLALRHDGKRFNSPNDLVLAADGTIYFTDPPYGLKGLYASPVKEQPHNGVYRRSPGGTVTLVDDEITFPNGIVLSPDERTLYVANSDPEHAVWYAYAIAGDGTVGARRLFRDETEHVGPARPGLPDGMAMDEAGHLFATGPGGVLVFAPDGTLLGRIDAGSAAANCAFGEDGRTLFIAAEDRVLRVRTATMGKGY